MDFEEVVAVGFEGGEEGGGDLGGDDEVEFFDGEFGDGEPLVGGLSAGDFDGFVGLGGGRRGWGVGRDGEGGGDEELGEEVVEGGGVVGVGRRGGVVGVGVGGGLVDLVGWFVLRGSVGSETDIDEILEFELGLILQELAEPGVVNTVFVQCRSHIHRLRLHLIHRPNSH